MGVSHGLGVIASLSDRGREIFVPTVSAVPGGVMLRLFFTRPPKLLMPGFAGSGIVVVAPGQFGDFGFRPVAFDRILLKEILRKNISDAAGMDSEMRAVATAGFAGRPVRRLAEDAGRKRMADRKYLAKELSARLADYLCPYGFSDSLVRLYGMMGFSGISGREPPQFRLIRRTISGLETEQQASRPEDRHADRIARAAALAALKRLLALWEKMNALYEDPLSLAGLQYEAGQGEAELGRLCGWVRYRGGPGFLDRGLSYRPA
ncbi:hypothetical protein LOC54_10315 [Acetobacter sp. AN02]|uniref:hypothetical protein n=1 Tax=Acetobacter sp. AN02 TaxID=2894186 RepID=UPI002434312A|nr:hypothetical protein [Acetobacter sp. AN02]MDG6095491.1 hypothetical protein [Acetobacter sp. AN02]